MIVTSPNLVNGDFGDFGDFSILLLVSSPNLVVGDFGDFSVLFFERSFEDFEDGVHVLS